jgi:hypothetical protein
MSDPRVAKDARFAKVLTDARFTRTTHATQQPTPDDRFASVFEDTRFAVGAPMVDKTGKRVKQSRSAPLKAYYDIPAEEDDEEKDLVSSLARQGHDGPSSSSSDESSSSSDSGSDSDPIDDEDDEMLVHLAHMRGGGAVDTLADDEGATRRLALVNLDWDHVGSVDVLVMLRSFCPSQGSITRVAVYPSQFGLERMATEDLQGPLLLQGPTATADELTEAQREQLVRKYEMERLLYYYGVVECDSAQTAQAIYSACDGADFGDSGNVIDLRFIPDEQEFPHPPRDEATHVPHAYRPPDYETDALTQSHVEVRWDTTPADR